MYWLWKWLESYNNCTFSTWKDIFVFSLLFWIPNSLSTFHDYGRGELPCLPWRPVADFLSFRFLNNFHALKLFTMLKSFLSFRTFEQLVLALKNRACPEFTVLNIYFYSFRILNNLRLPWKTEFALKFFTALKYFLSIRIFEELALALKTEFVTKFYTVFNMLFTFRVFEQLLLSRKNRVCPEFTVWNMYFLSFRIFNNLRLPWKTEFALKFFAVLKYFLSFRFLSNLSLPCKQSLPWILQAGRRPPPPRTPLVVNNHAPLCNTSRKQKRMRQKPWLTPGIYKSILTKNKMYHKVYNKKNTPL